MKNTIRSRSGFRSKSRRKALPRKTAASHAESVVGQPQRFSKSALWAIGVVVVATLVAYLNSFSGAFVYDDVPSIVENRTIRQLWSLDLVLSPPLTSSSAGRPLLNFSFAFNYALGGLAVQGYHALNLAIHMANALLLFGVVRRTLSLAAIRDRIGGAAVTLAFAIALLWAVHPLQTESVTYIVQRAESLVSLFYLLTLYCVIRGADSGKPAVWYSGAVVACLLGMSAKEVMVTAPVIVLLYDRMFLAGTFKKALKLRPWLYAGLALTWLLLAYLVASMGALAAMYSSTGFEGARGSSTSWSYAATQPGVILHYLRLTVWPNPLVLDYGWPVAKTAGDVLPAATVILALLAVTVWGLLARKAWGFLGAWFFLILSPTSSVVPLADDFIYEHRMYLALAAPLAAIVLAGYFGSKELESRGLARKLIAPATGLGILIVLATLLGVLTHQRNKDYASELSFWKDTVEKSPANPRAHLGFGKALAVIGRTEDAVAHYLEALKLKPGYPEVHSNIGNAYASLGRFDQAVAHLKEAVRLKPALAGAYINLGNVLSELGKSDAAIANYRQALGLKPDFAEAHHNLGRVLAKSGRNDEAIPHYQEALRLKPDYAEARNNLGSLLASIGQFDEAIAQYQEALRLRPDYAEAHYNLGRAFTQVGNFAQAISHYQESLKLNPGSAEAHNNLGNVLMNIGQLSEAVAHFQVALRLRPNHAGAHFNWANALLRLGRTEEAIDHYREALKAGADFAEAHNNLGMALQTKGRNDEARMHFKEALRINPNLVNAKRNLEKSGVDLKN